MSWLENTSRNFRRKCSTWLTSSSPSLEVIMKLALALDTTPDEFLTGSIRYDSDEWRDVAKLMRGMNNRQLALAKSFLTWLSEQDI